MAYTEFYARTGGSDLNSGSSNADPADVTRTGGNWVQATRVFTAADNVTGISIGDFVSIYPDGTTTAVFIARVTDVQAGPKTVTCSSSVKVGTSPANQTGTANLKKGGAWATLAVAVTNANGTLINTNSDKTRLNIVSSWTIAAALTLTATAPMVIEGCTATAGDGGEAVIDGGTTGASYTLLTISGAGQNVRCAGIRFQNNGNSGSASLVTTGGTRKIFERCRFSGSMGNGLLQANVGGVVECEAWGNNQSNTASTAGFNFTAGAYVDRCVSHDNAGANSSGFYTTVPLTFTNCIADNNGGDGFLLTTSPYGMLVNCTAYRNGAGGVNITGGAGFVSNCDLIKNGTYGLIVASSGYCRSINNRYYLNTSGPTSVAGAFLEETGAITAAAASYVDVDDAGTPRGGNFTPAAASDARAAGIGAFLMNTTTYDSLPTSYPDIGGVQRANAVIVTPAATSIYNGAQVTSDGVALVTGTLHASNISTAAGSGSNLSAGVLQSGVTVDDVTGTLTTPVPVFGGHVARRV